MKSLRHSPPNLMLWLAAILVKFAVMLCASGFSTSATYPLFPKVAPLERSKRGNSSTRCAATPSNDAGNPSELGRNPAPNGDRVTYERAKP